MNNKWNRQLNNIQRKPFITYGILAINVMMYLIMTFNGGSENPWTLIYFGAKVNELIVLGEWWRLITPTFLHIGIMHLILNSLIIYYLGSQLEHLIGNFRYLLLYLSSAMMGNAASFAMNNSISAGASTAVFGLFASTIVLAKLYPYHANIQNLSRSYLALIIINVLLGFLNSSIDNAGHIGGLLGGYLMMYTISSKNAMNNPTKKRLLYGLAYVLIFIILIMIRFIRMDFFI